MLATETKEKLSTAWDVAVKIAMPILLGISSWTGTTLLDHENRLTTIEASRYTSSDGEEDRAALAEALTDLKLTVQSNESTNAAILHRLERVERLLERLAEVEGR